MSAFARGHRAIAECMRCGFRVRYVALMDDGHIPGLRVCSTCYEPRHPQQSPPHVGGDRQALYKPAPEISKPSDEGDPVPALTFND